MTRLSAALEALRAQHAAAVRRELHLADDNDRLRRIVAKLQSLAESTIATNTELSSQVAEMQSSKTQMLDTIRRWRRDASVDDP